MGNFHFAHPEYLLLVPAAALLLWFASNKQKADYRRFHEFASIENLKLYYIILLRLIIKILHATMLIFLFNFYSISKT